MTAHTPGDAPPAKLREQAYLEGAHHEICTALTVLRTNVELVRIELRLDPGNRTPIALEPHLIELDAAVDRLQRLASAFKVWHSDSLHESEDAVKSEATSLSTTMRAG